MAKDADSSRLISAAGIARLQESRGSRNYETTSVQRN
ncbi:hypothetical protein COLO4_23414 [Corchorus olitorius]|uniref:Uncharacterized protein n=1 Tax=Corchorus olitorius TaxID=93759 RepID=A0A1R3IGY3_9ROSI|nr:hypothetical protein COLO4_23414 [Corchorus olitorius]